VVHVEHGNMPPWAIVEPVLFWKASDEFERSNGTVYRELEVSLPRELALSQQIELAKQLAEEACGKNHAFSFAIHHTKASDGKLNPHMHLQFSERIDDGYERDPHQYFKRANKKEPERGGCLKDRSWQATKKGKQTVAEPSERLLDIRQKWEVMCNKALDNFEVAASVDCRSYEEQGIDLIPQPKVGAESWNTYQRTGEKNERFKRWEEIVQANQPIVFDFDRLQFQKSQCHQSKLLEDRNIIRIALEKLRLEKPVIHSRDEVITALLKSTNIGKDYLNQLRTKKHEFNKAQQHYHTFCKIKDAPFKWGNLKMKIKCWLDHASREGEAMRLQDAQHPYHQARQEARNLLRKAKESPTMHAKAEPILEGEQEAYDYWQQNVDTLERMLTATAASLKTIEESLELLQNKHSDIDIPQPVQPSQDTECT